jgi:hypothetical protein
MVCIGGAISVTTRRGKDYAFAAARIPIQQHKSASKVVVLVRILIIYKII